MNVTFAKMDEVRRKRLAMQEYQDITKKRMLERCHDINPKVSHPEQYIEICNIFPKERRDKCSQYRECALNAISDIPVVDFDITQIIPDYKFSLYPGLNVNITYSNLNDYDSIDVLRNIQEMQQLWPYPLDQTTLIVMLGSGNVTRQHLLLRPNLDEVLSARKHVLIFNIDPKFDFGGDRVDERLNMSTTTTLNALSNPNHRLWTELGKRFNADGPPVITEPYDKFKVYNYSGPDGKTFTYVFVKSFANINWIHSLFWLNGSGVYKVYVDLLSSNPKKRFQKYLNNMYDEIYNQIGKIKDQNNVRYNNNISMTRRQIEGGKRRSRRR